VEPVTQPSVTAPRRLLALDSATQQCSVALWVDGAVLQRVSDEGGRNSDVMLPMVRAVLAEAGIALASLDAVAFGAGPGAFTGLRVACGVAQGLALGADLAVIPIGTLEALAETACPSGTPADSPRVLAALDARMDECYWAELVRAGADWTVQRGPLLSPPDQVPLPPGLGWIGVGDGFGRFATGLAARLQEACAVDTARVLLPEAQGVLRLAVWRWARGGTIAPEDAHPVYVRDKVALTSEERRKP